MPYDDEYFLEDLHVPDNLLEQAKETPRLLPGERAEDYFMLFEAMVTELIPDLDFEWFLTIDLAWLYFDIRRYRRWKNAIIATNQRAALSEALYRTHPEKEMASGGHYLRKQMRLKADALEGDPNKDPGLARELSQHGYDHDALNATAFLQSVEALTTLEKFIVSAHQQITTTLKELFLRRDFKLRAERARLRLHEEYRQIKVKQDEPSSEKGAK